MKTAFSISLLILFCVVSVASSYAQTQKANIPKFTPTVAWQVSPTEMAHVRGLEALKLPCIMKAGFNNGFVMRLSGGGNRIMAMAIDFRQRIFTQDKTYNARINIDRNGARSVQAEAFSESVLIFDLKNFRDLYGQLINGRMLGMEIEGNAMQFALGDIRGSLSQLEQCYSQTTQTQTASSGFPDVMMKSTAPRPRADATVYSDDLSRPRISRPVMDEYNPDDYSGQRMAGAELSKSMREPRFGMINREFPARDMTTQTRPIPQRVERLQMPPAMPETAMSAPLPRPTSLSGPRVSREIDGMVSARPVAIPTAPVMQPEAANVWNANAGDDMRSVLGRWAARAGVDLQWEATNNGRVASDVNVVGTFEEAVQTLMAQNAAALGLEADLRNDAPIHQQVSASTGSGWQGSMGGSKWVAARGASLRETLQSWSVREGVAFLWKANTEFKIKSPVQNTGDYTEALQELLNQYANDTIRPAAQFNVDPTTGNKLLTVE